MANRKEIRSRNEGAAGAISTEVASAAARGRVTQGPTIQGEPQGLQIARSLQRFAGATTKLGTMVVEEENEKIRAKARTDALLGIENVRPDHAVHTNAYNGALAQARMSKMAVELDGMYRQNPEMDDDSAREAMKSKYEEFRSEFEGLGSRAVTAFDNSFVDVQNRVWSNRLQYHDKYLTQESQRAFSEMFMEGFKELGTLDVGSEDYIKKRMALDELVKTSGGDTDVLGLDANGRLGSMLAVASQRASEGDATMLNILDGMEPFKDDVDLAEGLKKAKDAYRKVLHTNISADLLAARDTFENGVAEGKSNEWVESMLDEHPELDYTPSQIESIRAKARKAQASEQRMTYGTQMALAGNLDSVPDMTPKERKAFTHAAFQTLLNRPVESGGGPVTAVSWLVKNNYVDEQFKAQLSRLGNVPVVDGNVGEEVEQAFQMYRIMADMGGGKLVDQFGEATAARFWDARKYIQMMPSATLGHALTQVDAHKLSPERLLNVKKDIQTFVDNEASEIFGDDITSPLHKGQIANDAEFFLKQEWTSDTETAVQMANKKWRGAHTFINGKWLNAKPEDISRVLAGDSGVALDTEKTFESYFTNENNITTLLENAPDHGWVPNDIDYNNLSFSVSKNGDKMIVFHNDGISPVLMGAVSISEIGKSEATKAINKEKSEFEAENKEEMDVMWRRNDMGVQMLLSGVSQSQYWRGLHVNEIGYTANEWRDLPTKQKRKELGRLLSTIERRFEDSKHGADGTWNEGGYTGSWEGDGIDLDFIKSEGMESYDSTINTSMATKGSKSGVTIGGGIDLGQWSERELRDAGVSDEAITAVTPMLGLKGDAAKEAAVSVSSEYIKEIDSKVTDMNVKQFKRKWEAETGYKVETLPSYAQTIAYMIYHQYKDRFFSQEAFEQLRTGSYDSLRKNLGNWGDETPTYGPSINKRYKVVGEWMDKHRSK